MAAQIDAVTEFQNGFKILFQKRNWMVAVPLLVGFLVACILVLIGAFIAFGSMIMGGGAAAMMSGGEGGRGLVGLLFGGLGLVFLVMCIIAFIVVFVTWGWGYAAAEPIWSGGEPDIRGGFSKAMSKLPALAIFGLVMAVAFLLLGWTIIVPIVVGIFLLIFGLYILPYIMQGNQSAFSAISASMKLSRENFNPTLMLLLGLIVVGIATGIVQAILNIIPFIGALVGLCVSAVVQAFDVLIIMRFYNLLTGAAAPARPAPPSTPAT